MYAQLTEDADAPLAGVIYITDRDDVRKLIARIAATVGLAPATLDVRTLQDVIAQTRAAAGVTSPTDGTLT